MQHLFSADWRSRINKILTPHHAVTITPENDEGTICDHVAQVLEDQQAQIALLDARHKQAVDHASSTVTEVTEALRAQVKALQETAAKDAEGWSALQTALDAQIANLRAENESRRSAVDFQANARREECQATLAACMPLLQRPDAFLTTFGPDPYKALKDVVARLDPTAAASLPAPARAAPPKTPA